jgi:uncharacterized protein YndB with AHSA1/START domain
VEAVNFTVTATFDKLVTTTFERADDAGSKTRVTLRMQFSSAAERDFVVREYGAIEGGKQTITRLGEHLRTMSAGAAGRDDSAEAFVIRRVLDAPRATVWRAWTEREHLMRWFGPAGTTIPSCSLDLRPGGSFHYCMRGADGSEEWGKWVFREIVEPDRITFTIAFADEKGNAIRAPFDVNWPLEMLSVVTFEDHAGKGRGTVVTIRWTAHNASDSERATFAAGHDSMRQGWTGTLDRLVAEIAGGGPAR